MTFRETVEEKTMQDEPSRTLNDITASPEGAEPKKMGILRAVVLVSAVTLAMIGNVANSTTTSIALPSIGEHLNIPKNQLDWVVSAYTLSSACLLIFLGRLADLYGRKRAFIGGMLFTAAFSIGCGFANDSITLDILRAIQGLGIAAAIPAAVGILAHSFPPSRARSVAFATFSTGAPVGAALGMIIGGLLTQETSTGWRSNFFFIGGLCVLSALGGFLSIAPDEPLSAMRGEDGGPLDRRVDWLGALLVTAGLVLIVFVLSEGEVADRGWSTPYIIALLIVGVLSLALFFVWQRFLERTDDRRADSLTVRRWAPPPLMRPSLWTRGHGKLAAIFAIAFFNNAAFLAWQFWVQLYYQTYLGLTPILTMVRMLPMFVSGVLANVAVAYLVGRIDVVLIIGVGTACTACGTLFFALIDPGTGYWATGFPSAILVVIGSDFVAVAGSVFVAKLAADSEQSLAGAVLQTMNQLGTALGITLSTIAFDRVGGPSGGLRGYRAAQWTAFGLGTAATVVCVLCLRGVGVVGHPSKSQAPPSNAEKPAQDSDADEHGNGHTGVALAKASSDVPTTQTGISGHATTAI